MVHVFIQHTKFQNVNIRNENVHEQRWHFHQNNPFGFLSLILNPCSILLNTITLYRYLKENGSLQVESIAICDNIFTRRIYRTGYVLRCHCFKHFISRKLYFFIMECVQRYSYHLIHLICHFIITESWHYGKRMFCTFSFPLGKSEKIENDNKQKRNWKQIPEKYPRLG